MDVWHLFHKKKYKNIRHLVGQTLGVDCQKIQYRVWTNVKLVQNEHPKGKWWQSQIRDQA